MRKHVTFTLHVGWEIVAGLVDVSIELQRVLADETGRMLAKCLLEYDMNLSQPVFFRFDDPRHDPNNYNAAIMVHMEFAVFDTWESSRRGLPQMPPAIDPPKPV